MRALSTQMMTPTGAGTIGLISTSSKKKLAAALTVPSTWRQISLETNMCVARSHGCYLSGSPELR